MLNEYIQIYKCSIVALGSFNPAIIQPYWLAQKKLIREQEAQNAKIGMIHTGITRYKLEWCEFDIINDRFAIKTSQENHFIPMKDLMVSIFKILKETPVKAYGINHSLYYAIPDSDRYYRLGEKLGALDLWKGVMDDPRMFFLDVGEQKRKDGQKGSFRMRISPSDMPLTTPYGIMVNINDHHDMQEGENANEFATSLSASFESSIERSKSLPNQLWVNLNL